MIGYENELIKMYDAIKDRAGIYEKRDDGRVHVLLPERHIFTNAAIDIIIDINGNLKGFEVAKYGKTITGVTETSATRTSGSSANFITDNLSYVAADAKDYVSKHPEKTEAKHGLYVDLLKSVIEMFGSDPDYEDASQKVKAVLKYTENGNIFSDIAACNNEDVKKIAGLKTTVRFRIIGSVPEETWKDRSLHRLWIDYIEAIENTPGMSNSKNKMSVKVFSMFSGEQQAPGYKMPGKLLPAYDVLGKRIQNADAMKTHSSNVKNPTWDFTYKGRFSKPEDILVVGARDFSKYYCMIKYILDESCQDLEGFFLCAWDKKRLAPEYDWEGTYDDIPSVEEIELKNGDSLTDIGKRLAEEKEKNLVDLSGSKDIAKGTWNPDGDIMILGIRKSVPDSTRGRLSVVEYSTMSREEYRARLLKWHTEGGWFHKIPEKGGIKTIYGMPPFRNVAVLLYGIENKNTGNMELIKRSGTDKTLSAFYQKVMRAILYGENLPRRYMDIALKRASNPMHYKKRYNHENIAKLASSLVAKYYGLGGLEDLKMKNDDRNYLFGQLLAIAHCVEYSTYDNSDKANGRRTNAEKYMSAFVNQPMKVWENLYNRLNKAYLKKLKHSRRVFFKQLINDIIVKFKAEDFSNRKLNGVYIIGYENMISQLMSKKAENMENDQAAV